MVKLRPRFGWANRFSWANRFGWANRLDFINRFNWPPFRLCQPFWLGRTGEYEGLRPFFMLARLLLASIPLPPRPQASCWQPRWCRSAMATLFRSNPQALGS